MSLQPYQHRMLDERDELAERLGKLNTLVGSPSLNSLPEPERSLLVEQAHHMTAYFVTLTKRIDLWKETPREPRT